MLAVNLFALHRAEGNILPSENEKLCNQKDPLTPKSPDEMQAKSLLLDLVAGSLSALLLPVYTIRENEALLEYFALPASMFTQFSYFTVLLDSISDLIMFVIVVKLTLDWIRLEPHVLSDQAFSSRLQIWPSLCKLVNGLQPLLSSSDQSNKGRPQTLII